MEQQDYSLDFIELINEVKTLNQNIEAVNKAVADLKLDVKVDAPQISVEPTPINITERELPSEIKACVTNLDELDKYTQLITESLNKPLKIANLGDIKQAKLDTKKIEGLLDKIAKQKQDIVVKAPDVNWFSSNPKQYMPVRLTDGTSFYNAVTNLTATHTITELSQEHGQTIVYKTVADSKVIDYRETTIDGKTYRQTLSYDDEGNLTYVTGWVKQ